LFLFEKPKLEVLDCGGVPGHFVEHFDHERLGFDGGPVPGPGVFFVAPEESHFWIFNGTFAEGANNLCGSRSVAESFEGEGGVALGLSRRKLCPVGAKLGQEKLRGGFGGGRQRLIFQEEAPAVEVKDGHG
jgi:hypothetical protein